MLARFRADPISPPRSPRWIIYPPPPPSPSLSDLDRGSFIFPPQLVAASSCGVALFSTGDELGRRVARIIYDAGGRRAAAVIMSGCPDWLEFHFIWASDGAAGLFSALDAAKSSWQRIWHGVCVGEDAAVFQVKYKAGAFACFVLMSDSFSGHAFATEPYLSSSNKWITN